MWGRGALLAAVGGGLLLLAAPAAAEDELYQWTDEQGVVRYTPHRDRVPASARDSMQVVESTAPPPAETNGSPVRPGALPAVMGSDLPEDLLGEDIDPGDPGELDRRIEALREAIARDRAALRDLMGAKREEDEDWQLEVERLANRLPALQAELAELERIRREHGAPAGAPR